MITFKSIRWKNFLSTGNQFIEIELDKNPTTLIVGKNGSGKSTILDALTFGLFGVPFRKVNKPKLVNTVNKKECLVEVEFEIGTKKYLVARGIKPNRFDIYVDGKLLDQDSQSRDYQKYLEQTILKINFKTFTQVVVLGSSSFVPFMMLNTSVRRSVIEDLLDIEIFSKMNLILKTKKETNKTQRQEIENEIRLIEERIRLYEECAKIKRDNVLAECKTKEDKIVVLSDEIDELRDEMNSLLIKKQELLKGVSDFAGVQKKKSTLESYRVKIETNRERVKKDIRFFSDNEQCPTCNQVIDEDFKKTEIEKRREQEKKYSEGLEKLHSELDGVVAVIDEIQRVRDAGVSVDREMHGKDSSIREKQRYVDGLKREIERLKLSLNNIVDGDQSVPLRSELDMKKQEHEKLVAQGVVYSSVTDLLLDNGIKSSIIRQYLPLINSLINKYLDSMNFCVDFNLDEGFNETIRSRYRDEFQYASFSEGEKFRIDVALLFAWREIAELKNSVSTNLLLLDEVFDSSLDFAGTEDFLKILNILGKKTNIFVISHKGDVLTDKFSDQIMFSKNNNFSQKK